MHIPIMTSLTGSTENANWWPMLQRWTANGWVIYSQYGFFQGSTDFGGSHFAYKNGQPLGSTWTVNVAPGSWSGGRYYPNYYRFVNYYQWANLNNVALTGWTGGDVATYYANSAATYCSF